MNQNILPEHAVIAFLQSQIDKKLTEDKLREKLKNAQEKNDFESISQLSAKIKEIEAKFAINDWLKLAAKKLTEQLKFSTHISKGIHSASSGDNVIFQEYKTTSKDIVGTHSLNSELIDANGNAVALPLAKFFEFKIDDKTSIKDLILNDDEAFIQSLAVDLELAKEYHQDFKLALEKITNSPITNERNKQLLWCINAHATQNVNKLEYLTMVPLYPSVFTFEFYSKINQKFFSEENRKARENRVKDNKKHEQKAYVSTFDLASVIIGGSNPQNVSMLMSRQGGRNYLLPSLPPILRVQNNFEKIMPSKIESSIFNEKLRYACRYEIQEIVNVIKDSRNNIAVRNKRKNAIDEILNIIFSMADYVRTNNAAGWSRQYQLDTPYQYWLDPRRGDLEGEENFASERESSKDLWIRSIMNDFAEWLNTILKKALPEYKADLGNSEYLEWKREIDEHKTYYELTGKGVFL